MKFQIEGELKRVVVLRKAFFNITKDIITAFFLSQIHYWSLRTKNKDGWVYKTQNDFEEETGLSHYQQRRARRKLVLMGIIEEKCEGLPKRMFFRINNEILGKLLKASQAKEPEAPSHNQMNELIEEQKLTTDCEETLSLIINKFEHSDQETPPNTYIEENTTKNTAKSTTLSTIEKVCSNTLCASGEMQEEIIFNHWKKEMNHPNAKMDKNRLKLIKDALKLGYNVDQLCSAISGCALTPHNVGENDKGERYDGLHIILKSADQIDRFIGNYLNPPRQKRKSDRLMKGNVDAANRWLLRGKAQHE